ncbi:hypothetical protein OPIT5_03300 [Opitutaceae bacterium TAV5]|nr:hypothetical protein OPIT5_03300 [Opitutaceae bacterium TAV5]
MIGPVIVVLLPDVGSRMPDLGNIQDSLPTGERNPVPGGLADIGMERHIDAA